MSNVANWLHSEAKGKDVLFSVVLGTLLMVMAVTAGYLLLLHFNIQPSAARTLNISKLSFVSFLLIVIPNVLMEEVMFRLPLYLVVCWSERMVLPAIIAFSIWYACIHGDIAQVPMQGSEGIILSILFLKCGGLQDEPGKAVAVTTTTHLLFDFVCFLVVFFLR